MLDAPPPPVAEARLCVERPAQDGDFDSVPVEVEGGRHKMALAGGQTSCVSLAPGEAKAWLSWRGDVRDPAQDVYRSPALRLHAGPGEVDRLLICPVPTPGASGPPNWILLRGRC